MKIETGAFHTTSASSMGASQVRRDCPPARRTKPWNICYGGQFGCYWCPKSTMLEPCPVCGP